MKIYSRDYTKLTAEEKKKWSDLKEKETLKLGKLSVRKGMYRQYPVAVRHYMSLFPNNHLDVEDLQKIEELHSQAEKFSSLLDDKTINERSILNFIQQQQSYFIIASLLKRYYSFGHHNTFIFPEFQLGNSYKVDYLLIGKSSDGYEFVLVELEHPIQHITLSDGSLGAAFRKGLNQISDWQTWLEENFTSLSETFEKRIHPNKSLPREFIKYDRTRFHYVVIAGRREDFNDKTRKLKRRQLEHKITLLHYDNLYDSAKSVIGEATY